MDLLKDVQPLLSLISAVLSITVIGFVIRLSLLMRAALTERTAAVEAQKGIVQERLLLAEDELTRTRSNYEREMSVLKERLSQLLSEGKVSLESLVLQPGSFDIRSEIKDAITSTMETILVLERGAGDLGITGKDVDSQIEVAKALSLRGEWAEAGRHYDSYLDANPENWEAQFARAVAYANSKGDEDADLQALRAYSETIARMPESVEDDLRARLYSYRSAIFKRLKRLEEAESDLQLARRWATSRHVREDIAWNLACVYAMRGEKQSLLVELNNLVHDRHWREFIKSRYWWFGDFLDDPDVKRLLGGPDG
jgi:tetratricopeptide (TPR) repeat protein